MSRVTTATTPCECGHVWDEHEKGVACTVEDCKCVHFERADDEDAIYHEGEDL
jgi:hypothetical protein